MKERDAVPVRAVSIRHVSGRLLIASCTASFLAVAVILMVTLEVAPVSPPGLALSASAQKASSLLANLERARPAQEASRALSWLASEEQRLAVEDPARAEAKKTLTERERLKAESAKDMANPSKVVAEAGKELAKTSKVSRAKPSKVAEAAKDWARAVDVDETRPLVEKQMQERVDHAKALLKEEVAAAKAKAQAAKAKAQATLNASAQEQRPATAQEDRNDLTLKGAPPSFIAQAEAELQEDISAIQTKLEEVLGLTPGAELAPADEKALPGAAGARYLSLSATTPYKPYSPAQAVAARLQAEREPSTPPPEAIAEPGAPTADAPEISQTAKLELVDCSGEPGGCVGIRRAGKEAIHLLIVFAILAVMGWSYRKLTTVPYERHRSTMPLGIKAAYTTPVASQLRMLDGASADGDALGAGGGATLGAGERDARIAAAADRAAKAGSGRAELAEGLERTREGRGAAAFGSSGGVASENGGGGASLGAGGARAFGAGKGGAAAFGDAGGVGDGGGAAEFATAGGDARTALGIRLNGCSVESCVPGTLAATMFHAGDEIVEVDGRPVDANTCGKALTGSDVPGTLVTIGYIDYRTPPSLAGVRGQDKRGDAGARHVQEAQLRRIRKEDVLRVGSLYSIIEYK